MSTITDLLRRFATYYRPHRGLFALDFGSAVAAGLLELAFPIAVTLFIDRLLPTGELGPIALAALGLLLVLVWAVGFVAFGAHAHGWHALVAVGALLMIVQAVLRTNVGTNDPD